MDSLVIVYIVRVKKVEVLFIDIIIAVLLLFSAELTKLLYR